MNKKELSEYMSELSRKRKNPYLPFKDRLLAKQMGKRGGEATARKNRENKNGTEDQDASQS